jgi:hypothetical protein
MQRYSKAIAAVLGAGATAVLGIAAPHTTAWNIATAVVAMVTAASVFLVSNDPPRPAGVTGPYVGNK